MKNTKDKKKNVQKSSHIKDNFKRIVKKILIIGAVMITICLLIVLCTNLIMYYKCKDNIISVEEASELEADCIIILGAGVRDDGYPTWMLEDRILVGIDCYNKAAAPKLIMSGDHGHTEYDEVNTMKQYAIEKGIPSEDIFMDHAGFSTYETMYRAKEIFGVKKVVIITQEYHLYRAIYIAEGFGIDAYGVNADLRNYSKMQYYRELREWVARTKDFFQMLIKPKPTYLGESIDLSGNGDVTNDK